MRMQATAITKQESGEAGARIVVIRDTLVSVLAD